jgi:endonuclease/exonuclease/phosphatase family metal-dependent hydrolase
MRNDGSRCLSGTLALALIWLTAGSAQARDIPIAAQVLSLEARLAQPGGRSARLVASDPAIAAPFPDLTTLASSLIISAGARTGNCRVETLLTPENWQPLAGDGSSSGFHYRDDSGGGGIRRVLLRPGLLLLQARGAGWPCDLGAATQRVPVTVELRVGDDRYCAAFGGSVAANRTGRFRGRNAARPAVCPKTDLTVANLNILHGIFCTGGNACRLIERIDLLFDWIVASGCPDVVTLQEVWQSARTLIEARMANACPFPYESVFVRSALGLDDELILTRYPAVSFEQRSLYPGFRRVLFARIDHPVGPVDVFTTHLASSSDNAQGPCDIDCPEECVAAGANTVRRCQAVELAEFVSQRHQGSSPSVITGDFNDEPNSFVYNRFSRRGWIDTHLAAGNPECDPQTGVGCTAGREDQNLSDLESPESNEVERIDYTFLIPPGEGSLCRGEIDTALDADGDGTATRIFADLPNPFAPGCGTFPSPICWPSDHEGTELDLNCR